MPHATELLQKKGQQVSIHQMKAVSYS